VDSAAWQVASHATCHWRSSWSLEEQHHDEGRCHALPEGESESLASGGREGRVEWVLVFFFASFVWSGGWRPHNENSSKRVRLVPPGMSWRAVLVQGQKYVLCVRLRGCRPSEHLYLFPNYFCLLILLGSVWMLILRALVLNGIKYQIRTGIDIEYSLFECRWNCYMKLLGETNPIRVWMCSCWNWESTHCFSSRHPSIAITAAAWRGLGAELYPRPRAEADACRGEP
jgi:hypothetical protein